MDEPRAFQNKTLAWAYSAFFPVGAAISPEADLASPEKQKFIATHYNSVTAKTR